MTAPKITVTGQVQAKVTGVSRGNDLSLMAFGLICLVGTLGCFWLSLWQPWAIVGAIAFLVGLGFVLYVWHRGAEVRNQTELPPGQFNWKNDGEELALTLPLDTKNYIARQMLLGLRTLVQDRQPLPASRGAVTGNPADEKNLREYSAEERKVLEKQWAAELLQHDEKVVKELESAMQSLKSGKLLGTPEEAENQLDTGMPQLKNPLT